MMTAPPDLEVISIKKNPGVTTQHLTRPMMVTPFNHFFPCNTTETVGANAGVP